jgi:hypothetical protein
MSRVRGLNSYLVESRFLHRIFLVEIGILVGEVGLLHCLKKEDVQ